MKNKILSTTILFFVSMASLCAIAATQESEFKKIESDPSIEKYSKEIFSLVERKPYILDRKMYYDQAMAKEFDRLAALISKNTNTPPLVVKNKLLSGATSRAVFLEHNGIKLGYYNTCKAHACEEILANILYYFKEDKMIAKIKWDGQIILFGVPSIEEIELMDKLASNQN